MPACEKNLLLIHQFAVDSVLDFEGEGFKWVFCFQELFGKQSRQAKLCVNHSALCHGQMSTAYYKPAFYVHTLKSAHTKKKKKKKKKSWSVGGVHCGEVN